MIGIIGAMEDEVAALKEAMEIEKTEEQIGMTFVKRETVRKRCGCSTKRYRQGERCPVCTDSCYGV